MLDRRLQVVSQPLKKGHHRLYRLTKERISLACSKSLRFPSIFWKCLPSKFLEGIGKFAFFCLLLAQNSASKGKNHFLFKSFERELGGQNLPLSFPKKSSFLSCRLLVKRGKGFVQVLFLLLDPAFVGLDQLVKFG